MEFNLEAGFTKDEVKKEFRRLCKIHHPDVGGSPKKFLEIKAQFDVLMTRAKEFRPKPIDRSRTYYRITEGLPHDCSIKVSDDILKDGGTILHMFTHGPDKVTRLNIPSNAKSGMKAKIDGITFTLMEEKGY